MKRVLFIIIAAMTLVSAKAETYIERMSHIYEDSIEVGLLTCYPGDVVYSLYGHTAIRFHNFTTNEDMAFNYGVFNFKQKFFVARFIAGKTDYELGVNRMKTFIKEYTAEHRKVVEQVLNLNQAQKVKLFMALYDNWRPENCTYRYNFLHDNCTTRARDILYLAINSDTCAITYAWQNAATQPHQQMTWRDALHIYTNGHEWAELGDDITIGQPADRLMTNEEHQFLPINLMEDFSHATIESDGGSIPLVLKTRTIIKGDEPTQGQESLATNSQKSNKQSSSYPTPLQTIAILALICVIVFFIELKKKKIFLPFDIILLSIDGAGGILLTVLAFSDHPAMFINWQILVITPLAIVAMPFLRKATKAKRMCWWDGYIVIATIILIGIDIAKVQEIPLFTEILATCLITRCLVRRIIFCNFARKTANVE